jgi:hypothetical protein
MDIMVNRKKWVEALRSKEYQQYFNAIFPHSQRQPIEACCLGVAYHCVDSTRLPIIDDVNIGAYDIVNNEMGLDESQRMKFVEANDKLRMSFDEIADMVDALPVPPKE